MVNEPIVVVENVVKRYRDLYAVNNISFEIQAGQSIGLLGPNGAGKSTTIEMIEGITRPTSGTIYYKGETDGKKLKRESGIQFQSTSLMEFLTVRDQLKMFSCFYQNNIPMDWLIETCHLADFIDRDASKLSGGQRQRLLLAIALTNNPDILFLDEPTTGLDPQSRSLFWDLIRRIKREGKTIVLTTHYMDEAQSLCDNLIVMDHGNIIAEGSPTQLLEQHFDHVLVTLNQNDWSKGKQQSTAAIEYDILDGNVCFHSHNVEQTIQQLINDNIRLDSLQVRRPTLEDLFLKLTGHKLD